MGEMQEQTAYDFLSEVKESVQQDIREQLQKTVGNKVLDVKLTAPQTMKRYSVKSRQTLYNWLDDPDLNFPRPVKIRGRSYFSLEELRRFEERFANRFDAVEAAA
jgi:predicted DNA-binding transcriptional regulator AlpA